MVCMFYKRDNSFVFKYGKRGYNKAIEAAALCKKFELDRDEDELVTSSKKNSCYNCLFRRWCSDSFICMKKGVYEA